MDDKVKIELDEHDARYLLSMLKHGGNRDKSRDERIAEATRQGIVEWY